MLCEGHNSKLQNFLREQIYDGEKNPRSINFVYYSNVKFINLLKILNVFCVDIGVLILNFLIELIQGPCFENQKELAKSKIIDSTKDLMFMFSKKSDYLKRGFNSEEQEEKLLNLIALSNKALLSLIEGFIILYFF